MARPERVLCISDLHLSPETPAVFQAFRQFMATTATDARALYILGDFFNVWIGDDAPDEFAASVKSIVSGLAASGTRVYLMHGNRDFLLGEKFCKDSQATLIADPHLLEVFGDEYLLMHGDSLCTRDNDYMAFRQMVRNPDWQAGFLGKPLAQRQAFAEQARAKSRTMSSNKPEDIMDVTPEEVVNVLKENGQSVLIHGHTHRPAVHDIALENTTGKRIVLGDWDKQGWYLALTPGRYSLEKFEIQA